MDPQLAWRMILCDTNILIHAFNGDVKTIGSLDEIGMEKIILSSVTVMELYQGMRNKEELARMRARIRYFDVLPIDKEISLLATEWIDSFNLSHGLTIPDALIGASSVLHELELFTYNVKDFRFLPGIKLYEVDSK